MQPRPKRAQDPLTVALGSPIPRSLPAGVSLALFCAGTASDDGQPVEHLDLIVNGARLRPDAWAMPRFDLPCRRSGFWAVVPVRAPSEPRPIELEAEARGAGGTARRIPLALIDVIPARAARPLTPPNGGLIAICMATFEPDADMFRIQIESIRAQTDQGWICVISDDHSSPERFALLRSIVGDDKRFVVSRGESRIGFYRNFERALSLAPAEAQLLALCDQDDAWHPEKLEVLRASLGSAMLVYSDQRLVDERGGVLSDTLWRGRRNNFTNMSSMLISNTVTGAASLFRREVAERALPFPDSPGIELHDHWIALVALASGDLAYVDRPLYDYVQHRGAFFGNVPDRARPASHRRRLLRRPRLRRWRAAYFMGYVPGEVRAKTLLLRCADRLTPPKRRGLERYLSARSSPTGLAWLLLRPARRLAGRSETLGTEWELALGVLWRHLALFLARIPRWPDRLLLDTRFPDPSDFEQKRQRRWRKQFW